MTADQVGASAAGWIRTIDRVVERIRADVEPEDVHHLQWLRNDITCLLGSARAGEAEHHWRDDSTDTQQQAGIEHWRCTDPGCDATRTVDARAAGEAPQVDEGADAAPSCVHCPDGHADPTSRPWGVSMAPERDSDGQPTHLVVQPTAGQHVAESDVEWVWGRLNAPAAAVMDREALSDAFLVDLTQHEGTLPGCTGAAECPAPAHEHGCFADTEGHCSDPSDHLSQHVSLSAEEATREAMTDVLSIAVDEDWPVGLLASLRDLGWTLAPARGDAAPAAPLRTEWGVLANDQSVIRVSATRDQAEAARHFADGDLPLVRIETWEVRDV